MASHPPEKHGLPTRSATGNESDEEAVRDFDPNNTAGILQERLQAWKHACGCLENYVSATEKAQKAHAKEYEKISKSINQPLREGRHFDQSLGGIAGLFENMRANTQSISDSHLEASKSLGSSVVPILKNLHSEIKNKSKELAKGAGKGAKAVEAARNSTQEHIELLGQYAAIFDSAGAKIEAANDPYVLHRSIQYRLHRQVLEENANHDDLVAARNDFAAFEAHIVQTFQHALGALLQTIGNQCDKEKALYTDISGTAQRIPGDFEWDRFLHRFGEIMVDPSAPKRDVKHISYPNQGHASTKPVMAGTLERKGRAIGALTGYKPGYYVVTPSKYLHQYESDDDFDQEPKPEMSLYLPDCTVSPLSGDLFQIKGKDAGRKTFAITHDLKFRASPRHEAEKWHEVLSKFATKGEFTDSVPTSPVNGKSEPPPQTENVPKEEKDLSDAPKGDTGPGGAHVETPESAGGQTSGVTESPAGAKESAATTSA